MVANLLAQGNVTVSDILPKFQGFVTAANIANTTYILGLIFIAFIVAVFAYFVIKKVI